MNSKISYLTVIRTLIFHLSIVFVFLSGFSATAFICFLVSYFVRLFSISGVYHRYYSHRSYDMSRWLRFVLTFIGTTAGQKGPLSWATSHIKHHQSSDRVGDPHSPVLKNGLYAHFGWILEKNALPTDEKLVKSFMKFPEIVFLNRHHYIGTVSLIVALALLGYYLSIYHTNLGTSALQLVSWGFILPTLIILHGTCVVNSITHLYGNRRFKTNDNSRNVWWLFPLNIGENWHNNHHYKPRSASTSYVWWEVDLIYLGILALEKTGLAWNVQRPDSGFAVKST